MKIMKKNYFLTVISLLFCFVVQAQVTYSGNGNSGFGDVFGGSGNIQITDNGTQISFTLNKGLGDLNNTMVIYIDSKSGGFSNTSTFTDTADGLRRGVSGFDGTNRSTVNFPAGFEADYAIAFDQNFAGLWLLDNVNSFTYQTSANLTPTATTTSATYTFDVDFSEIGITANDNFKFVVTYLNDTNAFRSDEAIGDGISSGNPGTTDVTFSGDRSYPNTWTGTTDNDWATATNWTEGVPTATHNVYIPMVTNQPTASAAVTINKATINSGASLIANSTFAGTINYNVHVGDTDWHLVSSPVTGEQYDDTWVANNNIATGVTNTNNRAIATYQNGTADGTTGHWTYFQSGGSATIFGDGVGYSLKRTESGNYTFTGTFPTSDVSTAISQDVNKWNMIGNPYPSYINIATFISTNTSNLSSGFQAIYVWNASTSSYDDLTTGYIHPGQAFFVNSNVSSGNASITEAMQSHQSMIPFYKNSNPSIELKVTDGTKSKSTFINYLDGKTTGLDPRFDIGMFDGVSSDLRIYSHLIENNEGISFKRQALPNQNLESMIIPIGVEATANTEISISTKTLNLPTGIKVFIEDKENNTFTRLDEVNSEYKITLTEALNGVGRFYLHTSQSALSVNDITLNSISIFKQNASTLKIIGLPQGKSTVSIFNILGKQVMTTSFETNGNKEISLPKLASGVYFTRILTESGKVSKKIILE